MSDKKYINCEPKQINKLRSFFLWEEPKIVLECSTRETIPATGQIRLSIWVNTNVDVNDKEAIKALNPERLIEIKPCLDGYVEAEYAVFKRFNDELGFNFYPPKVCTREDIYNMGENSNAVTEAA